MRRLVALFVLCSAALLTPAADPPAKGGLKFEVKIDAKLVGPKPETGRVVIAIGKGKRGPSFPARPSRLKHRKARSVPGW